MCVFPVKSSQVQNYKIWTKCLIFRGVFFSLKELSGRHTKYFDFKQGQKFCAERTIFGVDVSRITEIVS